MRYSVIALNKGKVQVCAKGPEDNPKPALFRTLFMAKRMRKRMAKDNPTARLTIWKHDH
jgi:hypothetical protein